MSDPRLIPTCEAYYGQELPADDPIIAGVVEEQAVRILGVADDALEAATVGLPVHEHVVAVMEYLKGGAV